MRLTVIVVSLALLAGVNACSKNESGSEGGDGNASDEPGTSANGDVADFVVACLASSNLPRPTCECAGRKAKAQLSEKGYEFLVATLAKNEARAADLRDKLALDEAMSAGTFMVRGPAECAREQAGSNSDSM